MGGRVFASGGKVRTASDAPFVNASTSYWTAPSSGNSDSIVVSTFVT